MLSDSELLALKKKLQTTRVELESEAQHIEQDAHMNQSNGSLKFNHLADAGTDTFDLDFSMEQLEHTENLLYEIDEALKRIEKNTYGVCEMCDKPILKARLQALPFAMYCIKCQEAVEAEKANQYTED